MASQKFQMRGRIVAHLMPPRFEMLFNRSSDGGWYGQLIPGSLDDDTPLSPSSLARLTREAGDFFAANLHGDWIQEAVIARAIERKLTAYAIAARTGNAVSEDHVRAYLQRKKTMGSHKLQFILRALGMDLVFLPV